MRSPAKILEHVEPEDSQRLEMHTMAIKILSMSTLLVRYVCCAVCVCVCVCVCEFICV